MDFEETIEEAGEATTAFERELEALVLRSFSNGAVIEGEWEVELPVTDAPNWTVEIRKTYSDDADPPSEVFD